MCSYDVNYIIHYIVLYLSYSTIWCGLLSVYLPWCQTDLVGDETMLLSIQTVVVRPSPLTFICHYVFVSLPSTQNTWSAFLLVSTSICEHW